MQKVNKHNKYSVYMGCKLKFYNTAWKIFNKTTCISSNFFKFNLLYTIYSPIQLIPNSKFHYNLPRYSG